MSKLQITNIKLIHTIKLKCRTNTLTITTISLKYLNRNSYNWNQLIRIRCTLKIDRDIRMSSFILINFIINLKYMMITKITYLFWFLFI